MSHTPGPWTVALDRDTQGCNGWRIDSASRSLLAWLPWPMAVHSEEAKANAKLVAAAPDMLEALQSVFRWAMEAEAETGKPIGEGLGYRGKMQLPVAFSKVDEAIRQAIGYPVQRQSNSTPPNRTV